MNDTFDLLKLDPAQRKLVVALLNATPAAQRGEPTLMEKRVVQSVVDDGQAVFASLGTRVHHFMRAGNRISVRVLDVAEWDASVEDCRYLFSPVFLRMLEHVG